MFDDASNLDYYADPANYDRESGPFDPAGTLLLDWAQQARGPILELGCGTGRVAIPLARHGISLTALDVLPHLIAYGQKQARDLPIRWVCQDVRTFSLPEQFDLIFTKGAVFNHLLARPDQEAMLGRVREHLAPGGVFILDVGFNRPDRMRAGEAAEEWLQFADSDGREITLSGRDHYDYVRQIWFQTSYQSWVEGGQEKRSAPVELALRYFMPQEMEALLHYNGFAVQARYGDWCGGQLTETSYVQIYVCAVR